MTPSEQQRTTTAEALEEVTRFAVRQMAALPAIGFTAMATLAMLDSSGPGRITDLAVAEGISQPSMTAMVSRLERQGLLERRRDPSDGRIVLVAITDAGRDMLRRRRAGRVAFLRSLISALDPAGQRALAEAASALRHMTDQSVVSAALEAARQAMEEPVGE